LTGLADAYMLRAVQPVSPATGNAREPLMFYATSARISVAVAVLLAFAGVAAAQSPQPQSQRTPSDTCPLFFFCAQPSAPGANWQLYDRSGTLGRQGLGASPLHPEGPGNASY
jgi:hypothetical protein